MSQQQKRDKYPNRQAESAVPRPPQRTISPIEAQALINDLLSARAEFVQVQMQFPAGHPLIQSVLNRFDGLAIGDFNRLLAQARTLLTSALATHGRTCDRDKARDDCIRHGQIERQYERIRNGLNRFSEELEDEKYDHIRQNRNQASFSPLQQPDHSRRMGPAQAASRHMEPVQPRYHPMDPPPSSFRPSAPSPEPFRREPRRPTYEELLLENRRLRNDNDELTNELGSAREDIAALESHLEIRGMAIDNLEHMLERAEEKLAEGHVDEDMDEE
ncbi:hypothetical protein N431DRAFT_458668 [Stipitochalara longipes BDJ]|nr:hypothetical protein N431DRAFT_458668 [Stipitochalara longipes BDJ]